MTDLRILPAPHPHIRNFAVDILWCSNGRRGGGNGWSLLGASGGERWRSWVIINAS